MFIITGCGRSGTGYFASQINSVGINCGHESVFQVNGFNGWKNFDGDSSWYAAPYLKYLNSNIPIIHIIRDPVKVVTSFYRIGLFSTLSWRSFVVNPNIHYIINNYFFNPKKTLFRLNFIIANRKIIKKYSNCFKEKNELNRIWEYWYDWNLMIEETCEQHHLPYYRIKLEDLDNSWEEIADFVGYKKIKNIVKGNPFNVKSHYPNREITINNIPEKIISLAKKYNYNYN